MHDDFYLAAAPEPRRILGLKLRPLSLGHIILLNRVESVFVVGGVPDYNDLAISVLICSRTFRESLEAFDNPGLPKAMKAWHDRITGFDKWIVRLGLKKPNAIDLVAKCSEFSDYIKANTKVPYYSYNPSDRKEIHCPSEQVVKVTLMKEMNYTEAELMDRSWLMCLWDFVVLKAISGQVEMQDPERISEASDVANRLAELVRSGKLRKRDANS